MNRKTFVAIALALSGALGVGLAQARTDVQWSLSIGAPWQPIYAQRAPVYVQPEAVYVQPAPVYYAPPVVVYRPPVVVYQPSPVYARPLPVYGQRYGSRWDRDGDGIPDRYGRHARQDDRRWDNDRRWDRDRDGVPNRHDRHPDNPWRP
jgi:hypothetical protein